jgi:hypothetical protein
MTRTHKTTFILASLFALAAGACSGGEEGPTQKPEEGHAFLTIVGDRNVFVNGGERKSLTVKYHDDDGTPLAGAVRFRIDGEANGATLSKASQQTVNDGTATIDVIGGSSGEASFRVVAEAEFATAVDFRVNVAEGSSGPLKLSGTYELDSAFDLSSNMQGDVGGPIAEFLSAFDDVTDPIHYILEKAVDAVAGTNQTSLRTAITTTIELAVIAGLEEALPDEFHKLQQFGKDANNIVKRFGLRTRLEIISEGADGNYVAKLTVHALNIKLEGDATATIIEFDSLGVDEVVINDVAITRDASNKIVIANHTVGIKFGTLLVAILNTVVIPALDPDYEDQVGNHLGPFLVELVRCSSSDGGDTLGSVLEEELGWSWVDGVVNTACSIGVQTAVGLLINELNDGAGNALNFALAGTVRPVDENGDKIADKLQAGRWTGTVSVGATTTPLAGDQPFLGLRP